MLLFLSVLKSSNNGDSEAIEKDHVIKLNRIYCFFVLRLIFD